MLQGPPPEIKLSDQHWHFDVWNWPAHNKDRTNPEKLFISKKLIDGKFAYKLSWTATSDEENDSHTKNVYANYLIEKSRKYHIKKYSKSKNVCDWEKLFRSTQKVSRDADSKQQSTIS